MKPLLSICMMVKDEAQNLKRCLDSLLELREKVSSELIIIDTGSTDNTVEIAKKYTDKVYFHPWQNDFSKMRNTSIGYAKGQWVFIIDADEKLENIEGIIDFLKSNPQKNVGGATILVKNLHTDDVNDYVALMSPRIFRKTIEFRYEGAVHNSPQAQGLFVDTDCSLVHYGYITTDKDLMERKFIRTSTLLKEQLKKQPDSIYYRYQLATSYAMHHDRKEALQEIEGVYHSCRDNDTVLRENIYIFGGLLQCYVAMGRFGDEAIQAGKQGVQLEPEYIDLYFYMAQIYGVREEYENTYACYKKYLSLLQNFHQLDIRRNLKINHYTLKREREAYYNMALICLKQSKVKEARKHAEEVIKQSKDTDIFLEKSHLLLVDLDYLEKDFSSTQAIYNQFIEKQQYVEANNFEYELEKKWEQLSQEHRYDFCNLFESTTGMYGMLNRLRMQEVYKCEVTLLKSIVSQLNDYDINKLPDYYAYVLLVLMYNNPVDAESLSVRLTESSIMNYMKYLHDLDKPLFMEVCRKFLFQQDCDNSDSYQSVRIRKNIAKYLLFSGALSSEEYRKIFSSYIQVGSSYIRFIYQEYVFENELIWDLKNVEEVFLMYIYLSEKCGNNKGKVEYLGKAMKIYPDMHKGIEILLENFSVATPVNKEMNDLTKQLLIQLEKLVVAEEFDVALGMIKEAEVIIGNNVKLLAFKTDILKKKYEMKMICDER